MKISSSIFVNIDQTITLNPSLTLDVIIQLIISWDEKKQKPVWDRDIIDYCNFIYQGVNVDDWQPIREFYSEQLDINLNKEIEDRINSIFTKERIQSIVNILLINPLNINL